MYNVLLYEKLSLSTTGYVANLTHHLSDWQHVTRAIGGYWQADGTMTPATMTRHEMETFFHTSMGRRVVEKFCSLTTWEGEITQMDLTLDGVTYRRTMDPEMWHNKVLARFTDNASGAVSSTAWSETTESSDTFGESCYIDTLGDNYDTTAAEAVRDRRLAESAYPRSIPAGGLSSEAKAETTGDSLTVMCEGYVFSMNRRFQESDIASAALNTQISTLVGASEFVTTGVLDTNSLSMPVTGTSVAQRLWDVVSELIQAGDGSNRWAGGVYAGRLFNYNAAETSVTHYWRNGKLYDHAGAPVPAAMVEPDIIVQLSGMFPRRGPPGGATWDNTRHIYIEEVEFIAPNSYRLIPAGGGYVLEGSA